MWMTDLLHTSADLLSGRDVLQTWVNSHIDLCEFQWGGLKIAGLLSLLALEYSVSLCLSLYVCIYPDTWGSCYCGKTTQMQQKRKRGNCRKALKLHNQCCICLIFQYKEQVKIWSFINFLRKGQTTLKRIWFRSIGNPTMLVCDFLLKANGQLPLLCLCCYLWSADPLVLVMREVFFNACPVGSSSFLLLLSLVV